jgi:Transposase IS66 family
VLAPGLGRTKTGRLWVYIRDDRPFAGDAPPAAAYIYSPDRGGEHPAAHLATFTGLLQADGYAGFEALYHPARTKPGPIIEVACWAHCRRKIFDVWDATKSPIAKEALDRIAAIYVIEDKARFAPPAERVALRTETAPLLDAFFPWIEAALTRLSAKSELAKAFRYIVERRVALSRFVTDGRLEAGRVGDRRGGCSLPVGCRRRFRAAPSVRADMAPFPVAARGTGLADFPHPALSRPVRPSHSAGRRVAAEWHRGRASRRGTRPGSGGTRCLVVPRVASTSDGPVARCRPGLAHRLARPVPG